MDVRRKAALIYAVFTGMVIAFQIALAAGAPWGSYAMGGAFPGRLPASLRAAAVVQAGFLGVMAAIVLSRAGLAMPSWSRQARWLIWVVVGVEALASVLNLITPSGAERAIWAPVALMLLVASLIVALWDERRGKS